MAKKLELEEIKQLQIQILDVFDEFCRNNGLRYQLAYGTLIGAVRHHGFIPWDDDIDVCMPNKDYFKLIELVNNQKNNGMLNDCYRLAEALVDSDIAYHQTFAKIYDTRTFASSSSLKSNLGLKEGVFIDIFPICGIPEDQREASELIERLRLINDMAYYSSRRPQRSDFNPRYPRTALRNLIAYRKASKRPLSSWLLDYAEVLRLFPSSDDSKAAFDLKNYFMDGDALVLQNNPWFPCIMAEFEGKMRPIPERYDELLTKFYGDYMQLPPEQKRKPSHSQGFYIEG